MPKQSKLKVILTEIVAGLESDRLLFIPGKCKDGVGLLV